MPAELLPPKSSTQLIVEHLERAQDSGKSQKVLAGAMDVKGPNLSNWKAGSKEMPLSRVIQFADAACLSEAQTHELLNARLIELHGRQGDFCLANIAHWAKVAFAPVGDEAKLLSMWEEASSPAPHLVAGLLENPAVAAKVKAALHAVVQEELSALAEAAQEL